MEKYFPDYFEKREIENANALKLKYIQKRLDKLITDENVNDDEIKQIEKELLELNAPNNWNIYYDNNMEKQLEVDFKVFAMNVIDNLNLKLSEINVFDFYSAITYLKEKNKGNE